MKKLFTFLFISMTATFAFGQRVCDVSVQSIDEPTELQSSSSGTPIPINAAIYNDGPDDLKAGDSIWIAWYLVNQQNQIITGKPSNGMMYIGLLHRDVTPGDTFHLVYNDNSTYYSLVTLDIKFALVCQITSRNDLPAEGDATDDNNALLKDHVIWWNQGHWPLSTVKADQVSLQVYPNPASTSTQVNLTVLDANQSTAIKVYDAQGKLVMEHNIAAGSTESQHTLDVSSLNNGVYIVKVVNGESSYSTRAVVQR